MPHFQMLPISAAKNNVLMPALTFKRSSRYFLWHIRRGCEGRRQKIINPTLATNGTENTKHAIKVFKEYKFSERCSLMTKNN